MAKFTVTVIERITATYDAIEIEAEDEDEAFEIAEEMRVQGDLGEPQEAVEHVEYDYPDEEA